MDAEMQKAIAETQERAVGRLFLDHARLAAVLGVMSQREQATDGAAQSGGEAETTSDTPHTDGPAAHRRGRSAIGATAAQLADAKAV